MSDAYRFVVTYRQERQTLSDGQDVWRGWVELVYPAQPEISRRFFGELSDSVPLMQELILEAKDHVAS